jgi:hypothetical protein
VWCSFLKINKSRSIAILFKKGRVKSYNSLISWLHRKLITTSSDPIVASWSNKHKIAGMLWFVGAVYVVCSWSLLFLSPVLTWIKFFLCL